MRPAVLVSACLLDVQCRWDGRSRPAPAVWDMADGPLLPVCPEQLGGLSTPRLPAELATGTGEDVLRGGARVQDCRGEDVTPAFLAGARETLRLALMFGVRTAILADGSPSCGTSYLQRRGGVVPGRGVTAALLAQHGIRVASCDPDPESTVERSS